MAASLESSDVTALRDRVRELMPALRADLEALTRIPSVSLDAFPQEEVRRSADATAALFAAEGFDVEVVTDCGRPAVIAHRDGPAGAPTVLLYAHHDVQPPGDDALWDSPPFEPTERGGRLYGRGAADDKAGITAHLAAIRAHGDALPVAVTVFVEGEEEIGSAGLPLLLECYGDRLRADAIVLADSANWAVGVPALTTTLRGLIRVVVTVSTLGHGVHSGMYGGALPDAISALIRLLATLHTEEGDVAVAGLQRGRAADLDFTEERLRAEAGALEGVSLIGTGDLLSRIWMQPSITTIGIDAPSVDTSSNTLVASARAKVSMRIAPAEVPETAYELLRAHLLAHAPWGAHVEVELEDKGAGFAADATGPVYDAARAAFADAWGVAPVDVGIGGSIPFVAAFAEKFPDAALLVTGVEDPDARAHGANESLHLGEWERACLAEAILLARIGRLGGASEG